jgi:hypothetical protein
MLGAGRAVPGCSVYSIHSRWPGAEWAGATDATQQCSRRGQDPDGAAEADEGEGVCWSCARPSVNVWIMAALLIVTRGTDAPKETGLDASDRLIETRWAADPRSASRPSALCCNIFDDPPSIGVLSRLHDNAASVTRRVSPRVRQLGYARCYSPSWYNTPQPVALAPATDKRLPAGIHACPHQTQSICYRRSRRTAAVTTTSSGSTCAHLPWFPIHLRDCYVKVSISAGKRADRYGFVIGLVRSNLKSCARPGS